MNTNFGKEQYLVKTVYLPNEKTHGAKIYLDLIGVHRFLQYFKKFYNSNRRYSCPNISSLR